MKKKDWVINKLIENDYDHRPVNTLENYEDYLKETDSDASFASFKSYVYHLAEDFKKDNIESEDIIEYDFDEDLLISFLEEEVKLKNKKLTLSDLEEIAKKNNIPINAFKKIKDFNFIMENIYKVNSLSFKDEIDAIKLKKKIDFLERELSALKNNHVDYSILVDTLNDIIKIYDPWKNPNYIKSTITPRRAIAALFSDIHAGELVSLSETHGLNEYNVSIMKKRIDSYFSQIIEYAEEVKSSILYLKMLGDMINGEIHEELIRNSDLDTVESLILCSDYISNWIRELKKYFKEIHVIAISGNHGRFSKKPNFKKKNILNFDYLAYEFIKRETINLVDSFNLPDSPFLIQEILGSKFFTAHGDIFKGGTGLSPISGTWGRDIEKLNGLYKNIGGFDYAEFAHFHNSILDIPSFSGISIIVNGSVKGPDEFSINAVKAGSKPSQIVYTIEENNGIKFRTALNLS